MRYLFLVITYVNSTRPRSNSMVFSECLGMGEEEPVGIWLASALVERLQSVEGSKVGVVYGIETGDVIRVLGCYMGSSSQSHQAIFPSGVTPVGVFTSGDDTAEDFRRGNEFTDLIRGAELEDRCMIIWKTSSKLEVWSDEGMLEHEVVGVEKCYSDLKAVLLLGHFTVRSWMDGDSIDVAFKKLMKRVMSDDTVFLEKNEDEDGPPYVVNTNTYKKGQVSGRRPVVKEVHVFMAASGRVDNCMSFCIRQEKKEGLMCDIPVKIRRLVFFPSDYEGNEVDLPTYFRDGIWLQLDAAREAVLRYVEKNKDEPATPVPHLFYSELLGHHVYMTYPDENSDEDLTQLRKTTQQNLLLPDDRPFFRKANAIHLDTQASVYLENPHVGLNLSPVGGEVALVSGVYAYHHYMQDNMDDDGWGCAYRSFQTIFSWFRYQGYTEKPIPTHKDIQKCLVDLKDKPATFVGSRQWIGSTELSYCLQEMLDVTSKIMYVSSGADLADKARQLLQHFRTQGTPVMIGGGVLAHTILGIDFNEESGEVKWLILDPHYKGAENLKTIQNKGWVGWKGTDFWDANSYYNACLPQRPDIV